MKQFVLDFGVDDDTRIVDLGGTPFNWTMIGQKPQVVLVNLRGRPSVATVDDPRLSMVFYDGQEVPFPDNSFEICYSNSVIEHVGAQEEIRLFSKEIRRLAPRYYVQTPNRWFFVEPHFICVFIHWFPFSIKRRLIRYFSIWGLLTRADQKQIDTMLADIHLLTYTEMRDLFPDAEIIRERFCGLAKSIIAIKR